MKKNIWNICENSYFQGFPPGWILDRNVWNTLRSLLIEENIVEKELPVNFGVFEGPQRKKLVLKYDYWKHFVLLSNSIFRSLRKRRGDVTRKHFDELLPLTQIKTCDSIIILSFLSCTTTKNSGFREKAQI